MSLRCVAFAGVLAAAGGSVPAPAEAAQATGPLAVLTGNPRYFTDGSGKAIYLTGSHTWESHQDMGKTDPPRAFDYQALLDMMVSYNHNFMRYWAWESAKYAPWEDAAVDFYFYPLPWARTGPGTALDGKPKFDLNTFNQPYFDRIRSRVIAARDAGIYCAVMLFQGWSIEAKKAGGGNPWLGHPFHKDNNINGIDGDPNANDEGEETHTLAIPAVTAFQEAYVRKVIDTVNDLDNVLYEITNESGVTSTDWQYYMIDYIHTYEAGKPEQHPVGMTKMWPGTNVNADMFASPAEWISPGPEAGSDYRADPPAADGSKVILSDTDHLWGIGGSGPWVWMSFCRGLCPIYMDCFDGNVLTTDAQTMTEIRANMQYTRTYADKMNLAEMTPQNALSSTAYCLAVARAQDSEYLVYLPAGGTCTVDLSAAAGTLTVEWFNPVTAETTDGGTVDGGATRSLTPPWAGEAVLYLNGATSFFLAEPAQIAQGDISTLAWRVTDGTNVALDGESVAASGSRAVSPSSTTTYTLTADTPAGAYSEQVTVTVGAAAVLTSVEVSPDGADVLPGAVQAFTATALDQYGNPMAASIDWSVSGGGTLAPAAGNVTAFTSDGTESTFTITASSGAVEDTVTVTVAGIDMNVNCGPNTPAVAEWETDDAYVSAGVDFTFSAAADVSGVTDAAPVDVYLTCRHLDHSYDFPGVPDGSYTVRIHFYDEHAADGRAMDYSIEGQLVLDDFSIIAEAGMGKALVKEFAVTVSGGDGLQIAAAKDAGNDAFDCGIEIVSTAAPQPDTQNPTVQVTSPQAGATVDAVITITGTASDDVRVAAVEVSVDGGGFELATGTEEWTYAVDTAPLADGAHTITVRVTDAAGNASEVTRTLNVRIAPKSEDNGGCAAGTAPALAFLGAVMVILGRARRTRSAP